jgi:hypothetical protein
VSEVVCLECGGPVRQREGRGRPAQFYSPTCQRRARRKRERAPVADAGLVDPSEPERPFSYALDEAPEVREALKPPPLSCEQPPPARIPIALRCAVARGEVPGDRVAAICATD